MIFRKLSIFNISYLVINKSNCEENACLYSVVLSRNKDYARVTKELERIRNVYMKVGKEKIGTSLGSDCILRDSVEGMVEREKEDG